MRRVILDTDVASLSIKQRLPPALLRELVGAQIGITFVTLGELTRWATLRQWGRTRRAELDALARRAPHAPLHRRVARLWGEISAHADTPRPSPAAERHLDRGLLPGLRPAPRDPEHQGLQRLRRARGSDAGRRLMLTRELAAVPTPWSHSWSELVPLPGPWSHPLPLRRRINRTSPAMRGPREHFLNRVSQVRILPGAPGLTRNDASLVLHRK